MSREHYDPTVPSVTEMLAANGYYDAYQGDPTGYYLKRGRFVEACGTIIFQGQELDDRTIKVAEQVRHKPLARTEANETERWIDYIAQIHLWRQAHRVKIIESQRYIRNETERYQGTLDWLMEIDDALAVVDGKCGDCAPCTALQTAGYVLGLPNLKTQPKRLGLQFKPGLSIQQMEHWYKDHNDFNAFRLMVRWYWKSRDYR